MRTSAGSLAVTAVAVLLGLLVATQFRSREVFSRNLELETPASLTTLVATIAERNSALREEIFDLRLRLESTQGAVSSGSGALAEAERQAVRLDVLTARTAVTGPGVSVRIDGALDDRALADLVNELRNSGAEALAVNDVRVGPRSWFGTTPDRSLAIDGVPVRGALTVRAIGAADVIRVALTRTGGIVGQFELIYPRTRFTVAAEPRVDLPALARALP